MWEGPQSDVLSLEIVGTVLLCRVKVSCRAGAKRVEAKGVFVGAEVVRGPHWRFGDQDGEKYACTINNHFYYFVLCRRCRQDW